MSRRPRRGRSGESPGQLELDWNDEPPPPAEVPADEATIAEPPERLPGLVQRLKWDFRTIFPEPTAEALDAGLLTEEDAEPENVRALHAEHAREALFVLHSLDVVLDARRRGVDPTSGTAPTTPAAQEKLQKLLATEPVRLERWWQTLMGTYEEGFGAEAADAFGKALRAWQAGIEVVADGQAIAPPDPPTPNNLPVGPADDSCNSDPDPALIAGAQFVARTKTRRAVARLPVPKPLPEAVAQGRFGFDEKQRPIRPSADEVREITSNHAEKLVELIAAMPYCEDSSDRPDATRRREEFRSALAKYAEDFGQQAAEQLEAYARQQAKLQQEPGRRR